MTFCNILTGATSVARMISIAKNETSTSNFKRFAHHQVLENQLSEIKGGDDIIIDPDPFGA